MPDDPRPRVRVVTIVGLGHAGSTLLERLLAAQPGILALGEVTSLLRFARDREPVLHTATCGCGAIYDACELWSPVVARLAVATVAPDDAAVLVERLAEVGADGTWWVDSSKRATWPAALQRAGADVIAVHVRRDARDWAVRRSDRMTRAAGRGRAPRWLQRVRLGVTASLWLWWRSERQARSQLERLDVPVVGVGYEALTADPVGTLRRIGEALDLDLADVVSDPRQATGHSAFGNEVRRDGDRAVTYDDGWRRDRRWRLPYALLVPVRRANERGI